MIQTTLAYLVLLFPQLYVKVSDYQTVELSIRIRFIHVDSFLGEKKSAQMFTIQTIVLHEPIYRQTIKSKISICTIYRITHFLQQRPSHEKAL